MKTTFIGHRKVNSTIRDRLYKEIEKQIQEGCLSFIVGSHGDYDHMALSVCRELKKTHKDVKIEVVTSNINLFTKTTSKNIFNDDIAIISYDIEEIHFKKQIIVSNQKMIDECDTIICYVDNKCSTSGAKLALNYAQKKGLKIINLFRNDDDPTFKMSELEKVQYFQNIFKK